jgi:hypothetical protein
MLRQKVFLLLKLRLPLFKLNYMKNKLKRRDFVTKCIRAGATCCALVYGCPVLAGEPGGKQDQKPDPASLTYCGFKCTPECILYKASVNNDSALKKKAYEEFNIKERYGVDFDADKIFCFGCKEKDKPSGVVITGCTVRKCSIEKGYECCIQCDGLTDCDKDLWKSFPQFKQKVIGMQKAYQAG